MSAASGELGVGVVGLGVMGRTHVRAYLAAREAGFRCRLVAVCDANEERLTGRSDEGGNIDAQGGALQLFDPAVVRGTTELDALLADPAVQVVSICTHTDTHVDFATRALRAGKHVLVEKPMAVASRDVEPLLPVAAGAATLCMPAFCIRFWPAWAWLRERVVDGRYGRVRSATFQRLASPPDWSPEFYRDAARAGGALVDLHIHDADFVRWCFGDPDEVVSSGDLDHLTTLYRYADGPAHVVAEGGWDHTPGFRFRMRYVVVFEQATADFELGRDPELLLSRDGREEPIDVGPLLGYDGEVRHFLAAVADRGTPLRCTVEDAHAVARLLEAERASLETRRPVARPLG